MARLERLRAEVADKGIIPRREGSTGLPTEVYYLRVKELQELVDDPAKAEGYIEMARLRSKKRRRKKHLKDKAIQEQFGGGGHTERLIAVITQGPVKCLGTFESEERFMSETGFGRAKSGLVYQVGDRRILLTESEAHRAWQVQGVPMSYMAYRGTDLVQLIAASEDRIYEQVDTSS